MTVTWMFVGACVAVGAQWLYWEVLGPTTDEADYAVWEACIHPGGGDER